MAVKTFEQVADEWYGTLNFTKEKTYREYRADLNAVIRELDEMGGADSETIPTMNLPDSFRERVKNKRRRELLNRVLKYGVEQGHWEWELTLPKKPKKLSQGKWMAFVSGNYPKEEPDKWTWIFRGPQGILKGRTLTREEAAEHLANLAGEKEAPFSLKALLRRYVDTRSGIKNSTRKTYLAAVEWIVDTLGDLPLDAVTPDLQLQIGARPGAEPGTVGNKNAKAGKGARNLFRRAYQWAEKQGYIELPWYDPTEAPEEAEVKELDKALNPSPPSKPPRATDVPALLEDLLGMWLDTRENAGTKTVADYNREVGNILRTVGNLPLAEVRYYHVQASTEGVSSRTRRRWVFRTALDWGVKQGWLDPRVLDRPEQVQVQEPITEKDIEEVAEAVGEEPLGAEPTALNLHITTLEYDYITSRLADPDQSVSEFLEELVKEDWDSMQPFRPAQPSYEPKMRVPLTLTEDERAWLDLRCDSVTPSDYVRGLLHLKMYGETCIALCKRLGCAPEQAIKLALDHYAKALDVAS